MAKDKDASAEAKPKSKKKLLIIIVGLLVVLGGGGGGAYFFLKPSAAAAEEEAAAAEAEPEPGAVVPLEAVTINLADGHYLKLRFSLQCIVDVHEEPDGSKALDIAINLYSNRTVAELSSNEQRNRDKKELIEKIEKAYHEEVYDVYFTTFVIQ